jgi:hypothetical protein
MAQHVANRPSPLETAFPDLDPVEDLPPTSFRRPTPFAGAGGTLDHHGARFSGHNCSQIDIDPGERHGDAIDRKADNSRKLQVIE